MSERQSMRSILAGVKANKLDAVRRLNNITETAKREGRSLTKSERFRFDTIETEVLAYNERIAELEAQIAADESAAVVARKFSGAVKGGSYAFGEQRSGNARVTSEPAVYRRDSKETSFFLDAYAVSKNNSPEARERLERNARQVADARSQEGRALSTTNGNAGEFVPPLWMETEWIRLARAKRVTADLAVNDRLPAGTDVINLPKVATGTATGLQGTQNTAVTNVDMTTTSIAAPVLTLAGAQTISLQLAEQSPLNVDTVILGDLAADLATKVNAQVINGSGSGGNATGLLNLAGAGAVSWTGTDGITFQTAVLKAIGQVFASTFEAPDALVLAPRRAVWLMAQRDSTGRPLLVPADNGPTNSMGVLAPKLATEGPIGRFCGLDVYIDGGIPLNLGAGTNEDRAIVFRSSEIRLWESVPKFEVFPQTFAQNLSLLARAYEYMAFTAARYPGAVSVLSGSGFTITNTL
ncbi:phage major capsid protein [Streptomyces sp. S1A1-8]|nr:phage major capsid protein [Streptomyces sp. S1A1-8]QDO30181.1 phage major capsid protein [Streptomyces sp. S1A1-3]